MNKLSSSKDICKKESYREINQLFEIQTTDNERLLTKKEIAEFLNVSVKMIDKKVFLNEIPYLKVGKLVRFSKQRVLAWAEETTLRR